MVSGFGAEGDDARAMPSTRNCTPATPTLSEAVALRGTVPDTNAFTVGAVTLTVGTVVSGLVRDVVALACAKVVVDVVVALATATVIGADNCIVDVSARAC